MEEYAPVRYKLVGKIGEGVHGCVIKAEDLAENNRLVAIKKLTLKNKYGSLQFSTLREIKVLQHSECENIIPLIDIFPDLSGLGIVLEYMPYTLYGKMKDEQNPLSRVEVKRYTKMLLTGLSYLHGINIMHRDIKPANLLIDDNGVLKLADFGLARLYVADEIGVRPYSPQVASRWYRAPEILYGCQTYGPSIDMWACGCVLAEMLRGIPLFAGATDIEQLALVIRTLGSPRINDWPELKHLPDYHKIRFPNSKGDTWENLFPSFTTKGEIKLVDGMVKYNPKRRLTASEALGLCLINNNPKVT